MQRRLNNGFGNIFGMRNLVEKTSCDSTLLEVQGLSRCRGQVYQAG